MDHKTRIVFNGWMALSPSERRDLENAIREYLESSEQGRRRILESSRDYVMKVETGPLGGGCPCCGR